MPVPLIILWNGSSIRQGSLQFATATSLHTFAGRTMVRFVLFLVLVIFGGTAAYGGRGHRSAHSGTPVYNCIPLSIEVTCCPDECISLYFQEAKQLPEIVFRITADKRMRYDLRREIIVPDNAPFIVYTTTGKKPRYRISRALYDGYDCALSGTGNSGCTSCLYRLDNNLAHGTGNTSYPPYQTVLWASVEIHVRGTAAGHGTIIVKCTVSDVTI